MKKIIIFILFFFTSINLYASIFRQTMSDAKEFIKDIQYENKDVLESQEKDNKKIVKVK